MTMIANTYKLIVSTINIIVSSSGFTSYQKDYTRCYIVWTKISFKLLQLVLAKAPFFSSPLRRNKSGALVTWLNILYSSERSRSMT